MPNNKICGTCAHYTMHPSNGPWCMQKRREVSYLQTAFDCWEDLEEKPKEAGMTKVCSKCGRELPIANFGRHSRTKDGYQPCCRECQSKMNTGHRKRRPFEHNEAPEKAPELTPEQMGIGKGRRADHPTYIDKDTGITMKWCKGCKQYKPIDEFHHNKANKDGHEFDCKVCHNARVSAQHARKRAEKKALKAKTLDNVPEIVNDLLVDLKPVPTLASATDDQLVQELVNRGYTGNIIKKVSFIL